MSALARPVSIALIVLALALLAVQRLLPQGAFWILDCANRYLTVVNLVEKDFSDFAIEYPGKDDDPGFALSPVAPPFGVVREGRLFSAYPPLFPFLAAPAYALLGYSGLSLWPLLGALLIVYAVARIARACGLSSRAQAACGAAALACTPLLFYAFCFWEHTLAIGAALLGLLLALKHLTAPAPSRLFLAGGVFGLTLGLREEFVLLAAALFLALLGERRARTRAAWLFPLGVLAGYAPIALFQQAAIGSALGFHASANIATSKILRSIDPAALLAERWLVTRQLLAEVSTHRAFTLAYLGGFLALAAAALRLRRSRPAHVLVVCAGALVLIVAGAAVLFLAEDRIWAWMRGNGLLMHGAILVPALFALPYGGDEPPARIARLLRATALLFILLLCLTAPPVSAQGMHWGPRLMLPVYPLLCVPIFMLFAAHRSRRSVRVACGALLLAGVVVQGLSVRVLAQKLDTTREIADRIAAMPQEVVVSNIWWFPQEMAPIFYEKKLFHARDAESLRALVETMRGRGEREFLYVTPINPNRSPAYRSHSPLQFIDVDVNVMGIE